MASNPEPKDIVVFSILRESKCAECGKDLWKGELLTMEDAKPHCMSCADLDELVYLSRSDVCLTRRAKKYSSLSAVVVRLSRSRGHYERQGILVEEAALQRAEEQRQAQDVKFTTAMAEVLRKLFPGAPAKELDDIARHASVRGSGRVGRTAAAKELEESALTAAVRAAIRHRHTKYDGLLMSGYDRMDARHAVRDRVEDVLERWSTAPDAD